MKHSITFGIIGYGRFGKLWANCLSRFGDIHVCDKKDSLDKVCTSDILFLTVPISEMMNCCKKITPYLQPHTVVIDTCSVKVEPVRLMKKYLPKNQPIIATHPLFGPDSVKRFGLKHQKIVVNQVRGTRVQLRTLDSVL